MMNLAFENVISEIVDQYLYADVTTRPWIIGFSGGKDSTVLLQLVWMALERIRNKNDSLIRQVYVVCNDTMIENPVVSDYVLRVLAQIEGAARSQDLPIFVKKTRPRLEDSFWVNLIGKGYPLPNNSFRWCTERLKIKPTSRFVVDQLGEYGEALILIGTRMAESSTRAKTMMKHRKFGKRLQPHPIHKSVEIYAPIRDLATETVWYIINTIKPPWRPDNTELFQMYADAQADDYECPTMVNNKEHRSCGQSRFGCWVCSVVTEDKSMTAQIQNGKSWLQPLLEFRNQLVAERNDTQNRMETRRNGQIAKDGLGTYKPEYRASILKRLLLLQRGLQDKGYYLELITNQELVAIQVTWYRDLIFAQKVSELYNAVYEQEDEMKSLEEKSQRETMLLAETCNGNRDDVVLISDLLTLLKNKSLLNRKRGLKSDIENRISEYLKKATD